MDSDNDMPDMDEYIQSKHILDDVHDYIEIPPRIKEIIDTPEFQRLRSLKQLGTSYHVFTGASHHRFEHSIGVMYLAGLVMKQFQTKQKSLGITDSEVFCVQAAGLLHDLGHGPFSHVFDHEFLPSVMDKNAKKFRHEDMSVKLIGHLFATNNIKVEREEIELIKALVTPSTQKDVVAKYKKKNRGFLFEIIANEETGIDVDKWDYIQRDSKNCGIEMSFKHTRLLQHMRVIKDNICYLDKTAYDIYLMFRTRYELFKRVYSHKVSKAIEYMVCDIMTLADGVFDIKGSINIPTDFMKLTDCIIERIKFKQIPTDLTGNAQRNKYENLKKAQELIRRLDKRDVYKCAGYLLLDSDQVISANKKVNAELEFDYDEDIDIFNLDSKSDEKSDIETDEETDDSVERRRKNRYLKIKYSALEQTWRDHIYKIYEIEYEKENKDNKENRKEKMLKDSIKIQLMSLGYGMETKNPIEHVLVFGHESPNQRYHLDTNQMTNLASKEFREVLFRVYVKEKKWKKEMQNIFCKFSEQIGLLNPKPKNETTTPFSLALSPKTKKTTTKYHLKKHHSKSPTAISSSSLSQQPKDTNIFTTPPSVERKSISTDINININNMKINNDKEKKKRTNLGKRTKKDNDLNIPPNKKRKQ